MAATKRSSPSTPSAGASPPAKQSKATPAAPATPTPATPSPPPSSPGTFEPCHLQMLISLYLLDTHPPLAACSAPPASLPPPPAPSPAWSAISTFLSRRPSLISDAQLRTSTAGSLSLACADLAREHSLLPAGGRAALGFATSALERARDEERPCLPPDLAAVREGVGGVVRGLREGGEGEEEGGELKRVKLQLWLLLERSVEEVCDLF